MAYPGRSPRTSVGTFSSLSSPPHRLIRSSSWDPQNHVKNWKTPQLVIRPSLSLLLPFLPLALTSLSQTVAGTSASWRARDWACSTRSSDWASRRASSTCELAVPLARSSSLTFGGFAARRRTIGSWSRTTACAGMRRSSGGSTSGPPRTSRSRASRTLACVFEIADQTTLLLAARLALRARFCSSFTTCCLRGRTCAHETSQTNAISLSSRILLALFHVRYNDS